MVAIMNTHDEEQYAELPLDTVIHGDCLEVMRGIPACSVDAIVTDPPAGISFMGKEWDNFSGKKKEYDSSAERAKANADKEKLKAEGRGTTPYGFSSHSGTPTAKERDNFISFMTNVMSEALRVLKPGGHALVWSLPRTSHWTGMALEDAGWEVRDVITHLFGSGFPKNTAIDKQIDKIKDRTLLGRLANEIKRARAESGLSLRTIGEKMQEATSRQYGAWYHRGGHMFFETGMSLPSRPEWEHFKHILPLREEFYSVYDEAEREVIGQTIHARSGGNDFPKIPGSKAIAKIADITAPATPEAAQWQGFGSALKPAVECWWLCRKPLSEKSIAENVLRWGCGGINVDGCRVTSVDNEPNARENKAPLGSGRNGTFYTLPGNDRGWTGTQGRFPSNLLLSHSPECKLRGTKRVRGNGPPCTTSSASTSNDYGKYQKRSEISHRDEHGLEEVQDFECVEGCPIAELDRQGGIRKTGAKNRLSTIGFGTIENHHVDKPTVSEASEGTVSRYFTQFHDASEPLLPSADSSSSDSSGDASPLSEPLYLLDQLACVIQHLSQHNMNGSIPVHSVYESYRSVDRQSEDWVDALREVSRVFGLSQVVGFLFDCPSCLRLCDEHAHRLVMACQDGIPSLHGVLVDVHSFLSQHVHSQQHQSRVLYNGDGFHQHAPHLNNKQNNISDGLTAYSEKKPQTPSHKQDILFEPLSFVGMQTDTQQSKIDGDDTYEKCNDNAHIADLVRVLTTLACDLSLRSLFEQSIPQNSIDSNTNEKNDPVEWICHPSCPVRVLGEQAGESKSRPAGFYGRKEGIHVYGGNSLQSSKTLLQGGMEYGDEGSKARYFTQLHDPLASLDAPFYYFSKASKKDRSSNGVVQNTHPTTKSTALMSWLCRLITPPGGVLLDPFLGSGSTAVAAIQEGFHSVGIEAEEEYCRIAEARIHHAMQEVAKRAESEVQERECVDFCPIKQLDAQSGIRKSGGRMKHRGDVTKNTHIYHAHTSASEYTMDRSEGTASRYFTQLSPDPMSLWDMANEKGQGE